MQLIRLATDNAFVFPIVPIRAGAFFGAFVILLGALHMLYTRYARLFLQAGNESLDVVWGIFDGNP